MPPIDFEASRGTLNPMAAPKPGFYKATIESAEMRESRKTNQMYLNLKYRLQNDRGENCGTIFDGIFDPKDSAPLKFKLGQFMKAVGLEDLKKGELTDIMKLVPNRKLVVDVKNAPDQQGRIRGEVEPFTRGGYWPISEWADKYAMDGGVSVAAPEEDTSLPFDLEEPKPEAEKPKAKATPKPTAPADDF